MRFDEVKGITSDQNYVYVHPKDETKKAIKISQYYGKKREWHGLLSSMFPDIHLEEAIQEEEKLYDNRTYGRTSEERADNISLTKQLTKYLNYASWAGVIWLLFYPRPYVVATQVAIALPVIGLFLVLRSKGLIKIINVDNSPYPSLSGTLSMPPTALMIRVLYDYDVLEYDNAWLYAVLVTPVLFYMILKGSKGEFEIESKKEGIIIYPFLGFTIGLFTFFSSISINCTFDTSSPEKYEAIVIEKEISTGKRSTTYLLTLGPWGDLPEETEVGVTQRQFEGLEEGAIVHVNLKKGLLDIPWIYVTIK
ncbi:MAG: hypothetical protein AAGA85_21055 [Bacteroidota bacterium]